MILQFILALEFILGESLLDFSLFNLISLTLRSLILKSCSFIKAISTLALTFLQFQSSKIISYVHYFNSKH